MWAVLALSAAAGVGAVAARMRPTAWHPADVAWSFLGTAAVVWAAATSRWWLLATIAIVATPMAPGVVWTACAVAGFGAALVIGMGHRRLPVVRAASAALSAQALVRADLGWFHGDTALLTGAAGALVLITGIGRRSRWVRRRARAVALLAGGFIGVALAGAAISALTAQSALRHSRSQLADALSAVRSGDVARASELIGTAKSQLRRAADALERPWALPAFAVPGLSQQVDAVHRVADAGAAMGDVAADSIAQVDLDKLTVRNGVVDINAIELLEAPMSKTYAALVRLDAAFDHRGDQWLIEPVAGRLQPVGDQVDDLLRQTRIGLDTLEVAPSLLGKDGPRTYFVAFTTPAEARGAGGYMATWAELRVDRGRIDVVKTANTIQLTGANTRPVLSMPAPYLRRWGGFGAGNGRDPVAIDFWSNITMPPDLPTVADVISQMYPASGGTKIDGVIVIDVPTLARFLRVTGPIATADGVVQLNADNAVQYLLFDQYERFDNDLERDRVQGELTTAMLSKVFDGSLPGLRVVAEALGPSIAERRLTVWSLHEEDQRKLREIGIDGAMPSGDDVVDGLAVVVNNAAGNKLDAYLRRSVSYDATVDTKNHLINGTMEVTFENTVTDPTQLSPYAVGNLVGLPAGTNRMFLTMYTKLPVTDATVDGKPLALSTQTEQGWNTSSAYVDIPPGQRAVVTLTVAGTYDPRRPYRFVAVPQPSAQADTIRVRVRTHDGHVLAQRGGSFNALVIEPRIS